MAKRTRSDQAEQEARRRKRERIIMAVTAVLIAVVTYLQSRVFSGQTVGIPLSTNALIFSLININIILTILLIFLIVRNVVKLIYERRRGIVGSKLRMRLVTAFVGLSLIPTVLLFLVSINLLSSSIDNWFGVRISDALNQTLEVARLYYQQSAEQAKYYARQLSADITANGLYEEEKSPYLQALVARRHKAYKLNMIEVHIENQQRVVVAGDEGRPAMSPRPLTPQSLEEVYSGREVNTIEQEGGGDLIRGAVPIFSRSAPNVIVGFVAASYYFPNGLVDKIGVISKISEEYRQLSLLKAPIKASYIITLFIVMLLVIFCATWFGFRLAKGITGPIQDLADATHKIAQGDLDHLIEIPSDDEIGFLVKAFNQMTLELKEGKDKIERINTDLEQRRKYMETILRNISAGVVSVDRLGVITTVNRAAERMLGIQMNRLVNRPYREVLVPEYLVLAEEILREMDERGEGFIEKQIDVNLPERAVTLLMTVTVVHDDEGNNMGMVVLFEDLTELQKAERAAAWREVARRMAHEIKNPLTPVKLAAQRLQRKYGDRLGEDGQVFHECTKTIIDQVEVLKNLVNEFSRYARLPVTKPALNDLNEVINASVTLFQDAHRDITFEFRRGEDIPRLMLDPEQIRRVMVNLLDNAVAAVDQANGRIEVRTSYRPSEAKALVEVADNGCGIPPDYKIKMFEPYFSTKRSGTGLGLAIVNSIISDHHGRLIVSDNQPQGTIVAFELPVPGGA